jgi:multiple sugar transport system permease protein
VPYISWVLPLYFVAQSWGLYDTYLGLLLPHIAVHICFFSWLMKGFFDGIDPSMEHAALIDGCTRWGAFLRVACRRRFRRSPRSACCAGCSPGTNSCSP